MRNFLTSLGVSFIMTIFTIWAIHNYNIYAQSFDRTVAEVSKNKAYAEYLPILQKQIATITSSY